MQKIEGEKSGANVALEKHQTLVQRHRLRGNRYTDTSSDVIEASTYSCHYEDIGMIKKLQINMSTVYEAPIIIKNY